MVCILPGLAHGERYGGRNSVGNGTKRLQNGSIRAVFPLFCRRNPSSLITEHFFLENDGRWLAEKRHVIRDGGLRRPIAPFLPFHGLFVSFPTPFSLTWVGMFGEEVVGYVHHLQQPVVAAPEAVLSHAGVSAAADTYRSAAVASVAGDVAAAVGCSGRAVAVVFASAEGAAVVIDAALERTTGADSNQVCSKKVNKLAHESVARVENR